MTVSIAQNITDIQKEIERISGGRQVKLIGVTKTVPPGPIEEAYQSGLRSFGENRIQEALPKIESLSQYPIEWHFIGHLQTNKARDAIRHFTYIHSIDTLKLMHQVEKEAAKQQKQVRLLLEVNLGGEESKYGFIEAGLHEAIEAGRRLQFGHVCGLMVIPPYFEVEENVRPFFRRLKELAARYDLPELSMGMSHDYRIAVEEGATIVRIGTAIFGLRP